MVVVVVAHPQGGEREEVEEGVEVRRPHRLDELVAVVGEGVEAQKELKERLLDDRVVVVAEGVRIVRMARMVWTVWAVER